MKKKFMLMNSPKLLKVNQNISFSFIVIIYNNHNIRFFL